MVTNFTWDDRKEADNIKKHGVDFSEAATVFSDVLAREYEDNDHGEERSIIVGHSAYGRLLLVVFIEYVEGTAHIISARKTTNDERRQYEEGI